jgi:hypothetical protein
MKAERSIVGGWDLVFLALLVVALDVFLWSVFAPAPPQPDFLFGTLVPLPGVVTLAAFCWIVVYRHRWWKKTLVLDAIQDLGDRHCAVEGRLHKLDEQLVSPYTGKTCLAWLGWFSPRGDSRYDEIRHAVPFVIELSSGGACVVRMAEKGLGVWQHFAYAEEIVHPRERSLDGEDLARARAFFGDELMRRRCISDAPPMRELGYAEGDLVVLAGRFRRVEGAPTYRGVESLPVYEVDGDVVLAKGPAALHRKLLSPWLRARWPMYLGYAAWIELGVLMVALGVSVVAFIMGR